MATSAGATFWSWWVTSGHEQAAKFLKQVTQTATTAAAVEVAKRMQPTAAVTASVTDAKAVATAIAPAVMAKDAAKAVIILVLLAAGAFAFSGDARAQTKLQSDIDAAVAKAFTKVTAANQQVLGAATGKPAGQSLDAIMAAIAKPFNDLSNFIASDAAGATTLSTQIPALQDTNGGACWTKMQAAGAVFKAHPVPVTLQAMTDFEALRLLQMTANNLCSYTPCTVVFADGANLATAAAAAVGGAMTITAVPSLTSLCSRIPQISPMLPEAATGFTPAAPTPATPATPAATPASATGTIVPSATPSPTPSPSPTP
jgi:hypothetical protein